MNWNKVGFCCSCFVLWSVCQICSMLEEQVIIFFKYRISFSSHQEYIFIFLLVALGEIPSSGSANPLPPHKNLHHITTGTISRKLDRCCVSYLLVSLKINKVSISPITVKYSPLRVCVPCCKHPRAPTIVVHSRCIHTHRLRRQQSPFAHNQQRSLARYQPQATVWFLICPSADQWTGCRDRVQPQGVSAATRMMKSPVYSNIRVSAVPVKHINQSW